MKVEQIRQEWEKKFPEIKLSSITEYNKWKRDEGQAENREYVIYRIKPVDGPKIELPFLRGATPSIEQLINSIKEKISAGN